MLITAVTANTIPEDPVLSGSAAMEFAIGALDYGLIAAPKHFAFNDQETNRKRRGALHAGAEGP